MLDFSKAKNTIIYDFDCGAHPGTIKHNAIAPLTDRGQNYEIYNDKTCNNFNLKGYPANISINDFSVENLSLQRFCETFITHFLGCK